MNLTSLFENEVDALRIKDDQISGISALARRAKLLEKQIGDAEDILKGHKEQYRKLTEEAIPEALAELGKVS